MLDDVVTGSGSLGAEAPPVSEQAKKKVAPNPNSKHARVEFTDLILSHLLDHVCTELRPFRVSATHSLPGRTASFEGRHGRERPAQVQNVSIA